MCLDLGGATLEGDRERARSVLLTLADFNADSNFSPQVTATVRQRRAANPVMAVFTPLEEDWSDVVASLQGPQPVAQTLPLLKARIEQAQQQTHLWAQQLTEELETLSGSQG